MVDKAMRGLVTTHCIDRIENFRVRWQAAAADNL